MNISIIVPTYNRPEFLSVCLQSIHDQIQNDAETEIIVVDDGSSVDKALANSTICEKLRVQYFRNQNNSGMAVTRNAGFKQSTGSWIVFLDDDVRLNGDWFNSLKRILHSVTPEISGIEGEIRPTGEGVWDKEVQNLQGNSFLTCHLVIRRSVFKQASGFDPNFQFLGPFCEDHELAARLLKTGIILFSNEISVTHLPRNVNLVKYIRKAPERIRGLLKADYYFYSKHKSSYHKFRHAKTFYGTFFSILMRHTINSLKRRTSVQLFKHPLQLITLLASCIIEQVTAWTQIPYFIFKFLGIRSFKKKANPNALRIWFAASIPSSSAGGVNRSICTLSEGLQRSGHHIKRIYTDPRNGNYIHFALKLLLMQILHSIKQPDYIIARSSDGILCALFSSIFSLRTKIILHNHGWEEKVYEVEKRLPKSAISNATSWKSHFLRFPLLRLNLSLAKYCICGTIEEARWISNKYPSVRKKLIVIPNGITKTERPYWPSLKDLPPSFLIIGGFTWKKNIEYGINLFFNIQKLLPEARLFIIGTGKIPSVKTTLLDSIGDAVYTVERERPDNMRRWYETCPYLISTSRYEGGRPYGILEAQAKGMVVFSTDIPSVREFIFSNKNGVFLTGSEIQTDTTRIINTCNNVALVKKIGENGWKSASRSSIDRQVKRLEKILI